MQKKTNKIRMFFLVFLQTNKIITNSQCKQRIPSKSQAAMHDREEMQLGRSGTFCKGASLVALEALISHGTSKPYGHESSNCAANKLMKVGLSQQLLKFRMQQLRSQRGSKSGQSPEVHFAARSPEPARVASWSPPPLHSESG